jgi:hypothetical protein
MGKPYNILVGIYKRAKGYLGAQDWVGAKY